MRGLEINKVSIETTNLIKGLACIIIILHHYSQYYIGNWHGTNFILHVFSSFGGYYAVQLFFCLSGFGLEESWKRKKPTIKKFLSRRLVNVYVPFVVVNVFTLLSYLCFKENFTLEHWDQWLMLVSGVELVDEVLWFVKETLLLYFLYIISKQFKGSILVLGCLMLLCVWFMVCFNIYDIYIKSIFAFYLGVLLSNFSTLRIRKSDSVALFFLLFMYVISFLYMNWIVLLITSVGVFCTMILSSKVVVKRKYWIGVISYEVYLVHMKVFGFMSGFNCYNVVNLFYFVVITLLFASLLYVILNFRCLLKRLNKKSILDNFPRK